MHSAPPIPSCNNAAFCSLSVPRIDTRCHAKTCNASTAVASYFALSLECEHVVKKAIRLHCHSFPSSGSDTTCGRPTAAAAPTASIATAAIVSGLNLCQTNFMRPATFGCLESAPADTSPCERAHDFGVSKLERRCSEPQHFAWQQCECCRHLSSI